MKENAGIKIYSTKLNLFDELPLPKDVLAAAVVSAAQGEFEALLHNNGVLDKGFPMTTGSALWTGPWAS